MTVLSCGIATLGLLQNSVAVIIGAMLVSPLMGPIVALGFSLTTVDYRQMKRSVLAIAGGRSDPLEVTATVLTPEFHARAEQNIAGRIDAILGARATVELDQVVVSREDRDARVSQQAAETALLRSNLEPHARAYTERQHAIEAVQSAIFFPVRTIDVDPEAKRIRLEPAAGTSISLRALRQLDVSLQARFPGWDIAVIPVVAALPSLYFESGRENFLIGQHEVVDDIVWALKAWQVDKVTARGFASSSGSVTANRRLAERRAEWVAECLRAAGFDAESTADFDVPAAS